MRRRAGPRTGRLDRRAGGETDRDDDRARGVRDDQRRNGSSLRKSLAVVSSLGLLAGLIVIAPASTVLAESQATTRQIAAAGTNEFTVEPPDRATPYAQLNQTLLDSEIPTTTYDPDHTET
jgi:hypothetical protein